MRCQARLKARSLSLVSLTAHAKLSTSEKIKNKMIQRKKIKKVRLHQRHNKIQKMKKLRKRRKMIGPLKTRTVCA